jgi:hypothetical protein
LTSALATGPLLVGLTPTAAAAAPPTPHFSSVIEDNAPYQPQQICDPHAKPGVVKFRDLILKTYPGTGDSGITRSCTDGGQSEHKEGRAWDWTVSVNNSHQVSQAGNLFDWLFATDGYGHRDAMARRLGIMYIIWNKRIWHAGEDHWDPYSCSGTTGCHQDHVHFSFDWAGALAKTSYWSGHVTTFVAPPVGVLDDTTLPATVTVDSANANATLTPFAMSTRHRYLLSVSGTFTYRDDGPQGPMAADAECTLRYDDNTWYRTTIWEGYPGRNQLDLKAFGHAIWVPHSDNGHLCSTDHHYTEYVTMANTEQLQLRVDDSVRTDNHGVLTVTISRA